MEKCPECGKEFTNTKGLGSHLHYVHGGMKFEININALREKTLKKLEKEGSESAHHFVNTFIMAGAEGMALAIIEGLRKFLKGEEETQEEPPFYWA